MPELAPYAAVLPVPLDAAAQHVLDIAELAREDALTQRSLSLADVELPHGSEPVGRALWLGRAVRLVGLREVLGRRLAAALEYQLGRRMANRCAFDTVEGLADFMGRIGMGEVVVVEQSDAAVVLDDLDCATCRGLPNINERVCHLEAGFISRGLEHCTGRPVSARETLCGAAGDDRCRIVAEVGATPGLALGTSDLVQSEGMSAVEMVAGLAGVAGEAVRLADELQRKNELLERLATTDPLTGLKNRRALLSRLGEEVQRSRRYETPLTVAVLDIDDFKRVNDLHGHEVGDRALVRAAHTISASLRETDYTGRYGGEEFAIVLPHLDSEQARPALERVRAAIAQDRRDPRLTVSIGAATAPPCAPDPNALLRLADAALYAAKRAGKNRVELAPCA